MSLSVVSWPTSLLNRIDTQSIAQHDLGRLGNHIFRVAVKYMGPAYLKTGRGIAGQDLLQECQRLEWIGIRLPVPQVICCEEKDGISYVLISELQGQPSHQVLEEVSVPVAIERLAEALKSIHSMPVENCPFDQVVENDLEESARRVGLPGLDVDAFVADTGVQPEELLARLTEQASKMESKPVFTHGDFCFPNLLLNGTETSGIVDWGIAGVSDINRDFMSIELTVKRNCGAEWIPAFYEAYGPNNADPERIRFFWLLDRFFSHYDDQSKLGPWLNSHYV